MSPIEYDDLPRNHHIIHYTDENGQEKSAYVPTHVTVRNTSQFVHTEPSTTSSSTSSLLSSVLDYSIESFRDKHSSLFSTKSCPFDKVTWFNEDSVSHNNSVSTVNSDYNTVNSDYNTILDIIECYTLF